MKMFSRIAPVMERDPVAIPSRQMPYEEFMAAVAAAVERGDWAALPTLPPLSNVLGRCPTCLGTGYDRPERKGQELRPCMDCMVGEPDYPEHEHPGFDLVRLPRKWGRRGTITSERDGGYVRWEPCEHCEIIPVYSGASPDVVRSWIPWRPDCSVCCDTGWVGPRRLTPAETARLWFE